MRTGFSVRSGGVYGSRQYRGTSIRGAEARRSPGPPDGARLLAQVKIVEQRAVCRNICITQIVQQTATLANELQETTTT